METHKKRRHDTLKQLSFALNKLILITPILKKQLHILGEEE